MTRKCSWSFLFSLTWEKNCYCQKLIKGSRFIIKYRPTLIYSQPWCLRNHRPALINPVLPCCRASWDDIIREDWCSALQSGGRQIPSVFPSVSVLQQTPSLHAASKNTLLSSSPWPLFLLLSLALSIFPLSFSLSLMVVSVAIVEHGVSHALKFPMSTTKSLIFPLG